MLLNASCSGAPRHAHLVALFSRIMPILLFISVMSAASCARSQSIDIMSNPAACDTIPPRGFAGPPPQVPTVSTSPDRGAIAGVAVEVGTGRPLVSADVRLHMTESPTLAVFSAVVDSGGGFVLRDVAPGSYSLRIRAVSQRPEERRIEVRSGVIDTTRIALSYFTCIGY
jgi:hypothetical protein